MTGFSAISSIVFGNHGAGYGNRTRLCGLGSDRSTDELTLHIKLLEQGTGILRRLRRLRVPAHFLLAAPKAAMRCIAAVCRRQNACDRTTSSLRGPYSKKKCHPNGWHFFLCFHYTIDEHTSCRNGSNQLQNQARFCKNVFSAIWITKLRSSESAFAKTIWYRWQVLRKWTT